MKSSFPTFVFPVFVFLFFFSVMASIVSSEGNCVYTILVKTGTVRGAGTGSKISATLEDAQGSQVNLPNLEQYGKMNPGHKYFRNGNLDTFAIDTTCMESSVCSLTLTSDGTGSGAAWYVEYVQVLTTKGTSRVIGDNTQFEIHGWLALNTAPHLLTRTINRCPPRAMLQQINAII